MLFLEEAFESALGVAAVFADHAEGATIRGLGNQPIKIRSIVGDEPYASGVRRAILGQPHDGLHQGNGFDRWPTGGSRDAAGSAIRAHHRSRVQLLAGAASIDLQPDAISIGREPEEAGVEAHNGASVLGFPSQRVGEPRSLDNQIRLAQGDLRGTSVGEQLKSANLVDDAFLSARTHLAAEMVGNDQRARSRVASLLGFENANAAATAGNARRGEMTGG